MNKLSKKSIRIGAGILAILILMAGLLVFIGRKHSMRGELETLRIETREMNQDFSEEYQKKDSFSEYSESIRQKKKISREGFIPVEEIKEKLKDLPDNFAEIAIPTAAEIPCPREPDDMSTPGICFISG